jgi:two-component system response regulator YesN
VYSILLVDDEKSIREHLTKAIPFQQYGFFVKGTALNGKEALEKLPDLRPDLILLDVRMPVMDGLEFLKHLRRSEFADTRVVMLSGYNEFEYAKEAMKFGVKAYLNKPADEEEIVPLLKDLRSELDQSRHERERSAAGEQMKLFNKLYNGASVDRSIFKGYTFLSCVLLKSGCNMENSNPYTIIQGCISDQLGEVENFQFRIRGSQYSFLLPPRILEAHGFDKKTLAGRLSRMLKREGLECAFLFDSHVFEHYRDSFREDISNHNYEMLTELFFSGGDFLDYSPQRYKTGRELFPESKHLEELKQKIAALDRENAVRIAERLMDEAQKEHVGIEYVQEISYRIYYLIMDEITKNAETKQCETCLPRPNWMDNPRFVPFAAWKENLSSMILEGFAQIEGSGRTTTPRIGREVVEYVRQHYMEQITLKQVADRFFVNAAYLGRVFQRITGESFKEYLNHIRICEAKKLLLQTDKLVYEIASSIGFTESSYFIVKFTQEVGKSPTEFRNDRPA